MISNHRVTILVKASPQPSKKHAETVCCAGIDDTGRWRRLYPIRFRYLDGAKAFGRWNVVNYQSKPPKSDKRWESCSVLEESIKVDGKVSSDSEKESIVAKGMFASEKEAISKECSLALIRPKNIRLNWKKRDASELAEAKMAYAEQMRQASLFDEEIAAFDPCPYKFTMSYDDEGGHHNKTCADWETAAAFRNFKRLYGEQDALLKIQEKYCTEYAKKGVVFALGNMAKRPQTWQLLGIFPCRESSQNSLF